jgi:hypothetical protein
MGVFPCLSQISLFSTDLHTQHFELEIKLSPLLHRSDQLSSAIGKLDNSPIPDHPKDPQGRAFKHFGVSYGFIQLLN